MITRIQVKRKGNVVTYMPGWMVNLCDEDAVIISIAYEDESRPQFDSNQTVLELVDDGFGITPEMFHKALRFAKEHIGKVINVHCYKGQQRSRNIAEAIATVLPNYVCLKHKPSGVLVDYNPSVHWSNSLNLGRIRTYVYDVLTPTEQFIARSLRERREAKAKIVMLEDSDFLPPKAFTGRAPIIHDKARKAIITPIENKETN